MEKDSFEKQLRNKVLQAEAALHQRSDKDKVWNSIQKKRQPRHKLYYAAAAVVFIIGVGSMFYAKNDKAIIMITKTKTEKPIVASLPKLSVLEPTKVKQIIAPIKVETEQLAIVKTAESAAPTPSVVAQKKEFQITTLPLADEVAAVIAKSANTENKIISIASVPIVPEFTVQFKRGASVANNIDENIIVTTLKKFKLKRYTTYFANAAEKQPTKIKLSFKKEN